MLQKILSSAGIDTQTCAELLGLNPHIFSQWAGGQSRIPESIVPLLSAVLSVSPNVLTSRHDREVQDSDIVPQIWYKFRGAGLIDSDREYVVLIRQIGHFLNELEEVTKEKSVQWKTLFESIRNTIDVQAPPSEQGRAAASLFRTSTSLGHGATGVGRILRGLLRALGILLVETPLPDSHIEGCSFYVGSTSSPRPCVFANTHHTTWFRRNSILFHEVGHSVFEPFGGATLDFVDACNQEDLIEIRAQAFAQECLIPKQVLLHASQSFGTKWNALSARNLAQLVAETHAEQRMVIAAAIDAGFVPADRRDDLNRLDISSELRTLTDHALNTEEYLQKAGEQSADWIGKRATTIGPRSIRLPIGYVTSVVEAYKNKQISPAKAAQYLRIEEQEFLNRFGDIYANAEI